MHLPAYIYVCASTLIPACIRMGQLPFLLTPLTALPSVGRSMKHVKAGKGAKTGLLKSMEDVDESKKEFLLAFFKAEVGTLPEVC